MTTDEKLDLVIDFLKESIDGNRKLNIIARESVSDSISPILQEIRTKIDLQAKAMEEHVNLHAVNDQKINESLARIEPYIKKAEDDKDFYVGMEERAKKFGFWAGMFLLAASVVSSVFYGFKHIR